MKFVNLILITITGLIAVNLSGCVYGSDFDCPLKEGNIKCQPISYVADKVEQDLTSGFDEKFIYVRG